MNAETVERAKKIKLLLMDCDGVLTDGRLYFTADGETMKVFHVRDGQGLTMWHEAGFRSGIISGRNSRTLTVRANELGIEFIKQGSKDKLQCFNEVLKAAKIDPDETAFIGDDIQDVVLFRKVGFSIAVADAVSSVYAEVDYITKLKGGFGAVREVTDLLMFLKITS